MAESLETPSAEPAGPFSPVALIPAYQAAETVGGVVRGLLRHVSRGVLVDDGSTDGTGDLAKEGGAEVIRLARNCGKGRAVSAALARILETGATHVALVDADGQHDPDDLPALLGAARQGDDFVIGSRVAGAGGRAAARPPGDGIEGTRPVGGLRP